MLYPYRQAAEYLGPQSEGFPFEDGRGAFLRLVREVGKLFEADPVLFRGPGGSLLLLYRNAEWHWRDLAEPFGEALAGISQVWPVSFLGVTPHRETGEASVFSRDGRLVTRLRSVSGEPFEKLQSLCLRAETGRPETAGLLAEACAAISYNRSCAAFPRHIAEAVGAWTLLLSTEGSFYGYLVWEDEDVLPCELLSCLTAGQKETLWRLFLQDGMQPLEFDWLWSAYQDGSAVHLLEWELTLETALEALRFSVTNKEGRFSVLDEAGRGRSFDFSRGGPAEKLFLKLLFPVER